MFLKESLNLTDKDIIDVLTSTYSFTEEDAKNLLSTKEEKDYETLNKVAHQIFYFYANSEAISVNQITEILVELMLIRHFAK